jgi:hypothetical protein
LFGGHVRLVFTLVLFIYVACVVVTLTSFPEMPLSTLENAASGAQASIFCEGLGISPELKQNNFMFIP